MKLPSRQESFPYRDFLYAQEKLCKLNRQSIPQTEQSIPTLYHQKDFLSTIHSRRAAVIFLLWHKAIQKLSCGRD